MTTDASAKPDPLENLQAHSAVSANATQSVVEVPQLRNCRRFSSASSIILILVGVSVLACWAFGISAHARLFPGFATMKPITASGFVLAGLAIWLLRLSPRELHSSRPRALNISRFLAASVSALGMLSAAECWSSWNFGIDEQILPHALAATRLVHAGRMSPAAAIGFAFLGMSLLALERGRRSQYLSQCFALATALNGLIALVGYIYGPLALYQMKPYSSIALNTSILFVAAGIGVFTLRPQFGLMSPITSNRLEGSVARRTLPFVSLFPIFLGWIRWQGEIAGHYNTAFGLVLFTLSTIIMLDLLLWLSASWLNRADDQRLRILERDLQLAAIVDSSLDAILSKNLDGIILSWNKAAEVLFGYFASEIIGQSVDILIPPELHEAERRSRQRIAQGEAVNDAETVRLHRDGTPVQVSILISPVKDADGRIVGASTIAHDITRRKLAQAALQESEDRFQLMANGIPQLAWIAESDGHIIWYNQRWYEYTGTTFADMQGWGWQSVHDPAVLPQVLERWKNAIAARAPFDMEFPLRSADGQFRMFLTRVMPLMNSKGNVVRWFGTNTDISERKAAEEKLVSQAEALSRQANELFLSREALQEQAQILQSVLDNINDGLIAADEDGNTLLWNPAADRILGKRKGNALLPEWSRQFGFYHPDQTTLLPLEEFPLAQALQGRPASAELFMRHDSAQSGAWIEAASAPLRSESGQVRGGVIVLRDITQRVLSDREIRTLNRDLERRVLERTAQLEAVNRELQSFTYSVSHDLRAPLRQIAGFTNLFAEDFGSNLVPEAHAHLDKIARCASDMSQMIQEMLDLSRLERHELRRAQVDLALLVTEVISLLQPECEGRTVNWKIGSLPHLDCDLVLTRQILQNLISNALKYSSRRKRAEIEIGSIERDGRAVVFVRDNGAGFDMRYAGKLFGAFQRLHKKEDFEGTGIGLATVMRIVCKHGGKVWAEGEVERGATFYFTLSDVALSSHNVLAAGR